MPFNRFPNKVLVSFMAGIILTLSGYIFQSKDRASDAQAADIIQIRREMADRDVEIAAIRERNMAQYTEIIRRLERIERNQDGRPTARRETNG